jgi:hypothetical protein
MSRMVDNCSIFFLKYLKIFFFFLNVEYETLHDSSINHLTDRDQHYDNSGWIDTPLSNFGTNSTDMVPSSSPYSSYDFLCI